MLDLKRFLRFEISGYVAILYAFLFGIAFYDMQKISELGLLTNVKILEFSVSGFILSAPIGFLMHQIDISLFSPFKEKRIWKIQRKVISKLENLLPTEVKEFDDKKYQGLLEYALSGRDLENLDKEIGNRYSYYYAGMEAGIFSPIFGFLLFMISANCISRSYEMCFFQLTRISTISFLIIIFITIISITILHYCPTIFRELNDLECLAVTIKGEEIKKKLKETDEKGKSTQ